MVEYVKYDTPKRIKMYHFGKYSFSSIEIKHLSIALIMLTLTFMFLSLNFVYTFGILRSFVVFLTIAGSSFLFHEFGHKLVAQYYGFISEFRGDFTMMTFALLMSIMVAFTSFGFVFLAPGAVMIAGRLSRRQSGIVSVAGPLVNVVLSFIFIILALIISPVRGSFTFEILSLGIFLNAMIGLFNMIPFWVFDGKKILAWSKPVYFTVVILLVFLLMNGGSVLL